MKVGDLVLLDDKRASVIYEIVAYKPYALMPTSINYEGKVDGNAFLRRIDGKYPTKGLREFGFTDCLRVGDVIGEYAGKIGVRNVNFLKPINGVEIARLKLAGKG